MEKYHGETVEYWRNNADENYITTPISVLKYITVLEEQAAGLRKLIDDSKTQQAEVWYLLNPEVGFDSVVAIGVSPQKCIEGYTCGEVEVETPEEAVLFAKENHYYLGTKVLTQ